MQHMQPILKAFYLVGALLLFGALTEPVLQVWPLRPGNVSWRFGAAGLFAGGMIGMTFALAWIMGVAALLSHRRVLKTFAVLSLVCSLILTAAAVLFALDFLQIRVSVNPEVRSGLDMTVLRAMLTIVLCIPATLVLGLAGWRTARVPSREHSRAASAKGGLVYSTDS